MIGVDTNVLVRLLVTDDEDQQASARARVEDALVSGTTVLVTVVVVAELSWVLESVYRYDRGGIARAVEALADTPPFALEQRDAVLEAVAGYRAGAADLSDYLVLAVSRTLGALPVLTFDRKLVAESGCELP